MIGKDNSLRRLLSELACLEGKKCLWYWAGESTGSVINVEFGKKIKRMKPIGTVLKQIRPPNLTLTDEQREQREYEGEMILLVESAWRVDTDDGVLCGSTDSNCPGCDMQLGLEQLKGQTVKSVHILAPALDLTVIFEKNLILRVFCDQTNLYSRVDNYSFFNNDRAYIVGPRGAVEVEERNRPI
jgi:hypothetical protein